MEYHTPRDFLLIVTGRLEANLTDIAKCREECLEAFDAGSGAREAPLERFPEFWKAATAAARGYAGFGKAEAVGVCQNLLAKVLGDGSTGYIIFAFNEATALCKGKEGQSRYQSLLEALALLDGNVFSIFLDASSVLSGFVPTDLAILAGGTLRGAFTSLFRPLYCFPSANIFEVPEKVQNTTALASSTGECVNLTYCPLLMAFRSRSSNPAIVLGEIQSAETPEERWALFYQLLGIIHRAAVLKGDP